MSSTAESKTFSQWMRQISREHEDQIQAEIEAAERAARQAKIRRYCYAAATVILMAVAIHKRSEIGRGIYALTLEKIEAESKGRERASDDEGESERDANVSFKQKARKNFGGNMKAIQGVATERDRLLDEFGGK